MVTFLNTVFNVERSANIRLQSCLHFKNRSIRRDVSQLSTHSRNRFSKRLKMVLTRRKLKMSGKGLDIIDGVSCAMPSGLILRSNVHNEYIWTAYCRCVCDNVLSVHRNVRNAIHILAKNTCKAFRLLIKNGKKYLIKTLIC